MKKPLFWSLLVVGVLFLSGLVFGVSYAAHCDTAAHEAVRRGDIYGWMQHEFHLGGAQLSKIKALDSDYRPICDKHCQDIGAMESAVKNASSPVEKASQGAKLKELKSAAEQSFLEHLKTVAAVMPKAEGDRYYAMMTQRQDCMNNNVASKSGDTPR